MNVVVVGCSTGIGLAILKKLYGEKKHNIYATCRDKSRLMQVLRLNNIDLEESNLFELRLDDADSIYKFIAEFRKSCRKLEGVVFNAGYLNTKSSLMLTDEELMKHFEINYFSQIKILMMLIRKYLIRNKNSSVVSISTSAVKFANAGRLAYSASKSAMETSMRVMSREYARKGIRFNCVAPGIVNTKLMIDTTPQEEIEKWKNEVDLRRYGIPDDIANTVSFLLSSESKYMTGQVLAVDGGR